MTSLLGSIRELRPGSTVSAAGGPHIGRTLDIRTADHLICG
jgi:hypothetical protein